MKRVRSGLTGAKTNRVALWAVALGFTVLRLTSAGTVEEVVAEFSRIASQPVFRTTLTGFCLIELKANLDTATGYQMDTPLVPASTMKVITTAAANEILGPNFRFETELQTTGSLDDAGVLQGDVILRGGGDPTLGADGTDEIFLRWETALREKGVKKITGSVVGDASIFGSPLIPDSWQWGDLGNYYGAGACGLSVLRNSFRAVFSTPAAGRQAPLLRTEPELPRIQIFNEVRVGAAGSGDQGYIYSDPYGSVITLRGTVPAGAATFSIKGSLPDPARFCAERFAEYLVRKGIPVSGGGTTERLLTAEGREIGARMTLDSLPSEPLSTILVTTNLRSDNLKAESIQRMIGVKLKGKGDPATSAQAVTDYWTGRGVDMVGSVLSDGCGLSRANAITPRQMASILRIAADHEHFSTFYDSLPIAGRSGTLRSIGGGTAAEGRIHAKSGTMGRVRNYVGYVNARSGRKFAFALFFTNYTVDSITVKSKIVSVWNAMVDL